MVTGLLPFRNEYTQAVLYSLLNEEPAPPTSVRTGLPVSLDQVIRKALAKERERRYQHLDDFLVDLTGLREMRRTVNTGSVRGINSDRSIAVLPFANMNHDEESEFFSGGITEDINSLSAIPRLRVSSRNASFGYKGMRYGLREVSEKLNVEKVLEGSVRRVAQQVRITAELVDARDDTQLWAERYDRNIEDVFAIQDEIAQSIVSTLRIKLDADLSRPE